MLFKLLLVALPMLAVSSLPLAERLALLEQKVGEMLARDSTVFLPQTMEECIKECDEKNNEKHNARTDCFKQCDEAHKGDHDDDMYSLPGHEGSFAEHHHDSEPEFGGLKKIDEDSSDSESEDESPPLEEGPQGGFDHHVPLRDANNEASDSDDEDPFAPVERHEKMPHVKYPPLKKPAYMKKGLAAHKQKQKIHTGLPDGTGNMAHMYNGDSHYWQKPGTDEAKRTGIHD